MAAISHVFTLKYVAEQLGEPEEWLRDLQVDMEPEDGCLWVHGVGEDGVPAFTAYGIECLKQIIADERAAGRAPPQNRTDQVKILRRSPDADPACCRARRNRVRTAGPASRRVDHGGHRHVLPLGREYVPLDKRMKRLQRRRAGADLIGER